MNKAVKDVLAERVRQVEVEGWSSGHDDQHKHGELAMAAACYAAHSSGWEAINQTRLSEDVMRTVHRAQQFVGAMWPWDRRWWKPKTARQNLVRAAALLLAEIERIDRAAAAMGEKK